MRVELLGTGGFHPAPDRHTACVWLPELGLLLDAGTAAFRVVARFAAGDSPTERLDVLLTHGHLDHTVGLTYLLGLTDRAGRPVETTVHATRRVLAALETHLFSPPLFPVQPIGRFMELCSPTPLAGGATLTTFPLEHPGGSTGLRIDGPKGDGGEAARSLAYVTDTRPVGDETIQRIRGVDLLLHEAYFSDIDAELAEQTGHCTARDAAEAAASAGAGKLVMMHRNPRATPEEEATALAEAREVRPDAAYGFDGQLIELR
ncbi:MAG: MBL fold metallo-hydrolase [Planctomycetota bacterium]